MQAPPPALQRFGQVNQRDLVVKWNKLLERMQPTVFFGSAAVVILVVVFGGVFTRIAANTFQHLQNFILNQLGWFYVLSTSLFLVFVIWLMLSRFGKIKLGGDKSEPEFSYFSWFTMLFSAGMGTGLVFWGVAEPINHYLQPPSGEGRSVEAMSQAVRYSFFHWGLHPWAVYIVFGLSIAYFHFRHELPLAPRSLLYPLIGKRIHGFAGHIVDIIATVGTLFGVATSLGLGAMQINTGLARQVAVPQGTATQVIIIAVITAVAVVSVVSGIHAGIRRLSQFNIILAAVMFLFVLIAGPTVFAFETFLSNLGSYLHHLPAMSFWIEQRPESDWQNEWTFFYWSWWISWSPFVGIFVARISKGRTIREFILSVLLVPTLITFLWFSVFGGTALHIEERGSGGIAETIQEEPAVALHLLLEQLPFSSITLSLATLLVVVFFITSSDSGSLVDDMVTSGGHPHPPRAQRIFWAVSEGAVAGVLLVAGGLEALRTASLTSGLPMAILLLVACVGLVKALQVDEATSGVPKTARLTERQRSRPGKE